MSVFSDNCGANENQCAAQAVRLSAEPAKTPLFYREDFVDKGAAGTWKRSKARARTTLEEDNVEYRRIR